jgi:hypothetical protein
MNSSHFYDPLVQTAGEMAERYRISVSDVLSLLLKANRNEARVRSALERSAKSEEARAARASGKEFDIVAQARVLLEAAGEQGT